MTKSLTLDDLKPQKKASLSDLRPKFENHKAQPRIKITVPGVPVGTDVKKFYDEQPPEVQKDLSKKIVEKAVTDLARQNQESIVDERTRQKIGRAHV